MNKLQNQTTTADVVIMDGAVVCGDVTLGKGCSVWFNAVVRGDEDCISIGEDTNIQECAVLHVDHGCPLRIGKGVTVGHGAILHGCSIGENSLIGMGAVVLNGARIGKNCVVGAGALVTSGAEIPDGWMAFGNPARPVRRMKDSEIEDNRASSAHYRERRELYR